jgi:enolase-phosphatase E1
MTGLRPRVYLFDVEGTTSPVSLVSEQLFPYARRQLVTFLKEHATEPDVQADLALLAEENRAEKGPGHPLIASTSPGIGWEDAVPYLNWLMDQDRKSTALKSLQGRIWKDGYLAGELVGTVFPDVRNAFARLSSVARVVIYSSGSVEAQRLIFQYSSAGDLTPYLSGYFDTRTGPKTSPESYRAIAAALDVKTEEIMFVSDVLRELNPARDAGCQTRLSLREGNQPVSDADGHMAIVSFDEIS